MHFIVLATSSLLALSIATTVIYAEGHDYIRKRIVGGYNAVPTRYPYFTFLVTHTEKGRFYCGGALIHDDIVLTAAHCYQDFIIDGTAVYRIETFTNKTLFRNSTGYEHKARAEGIHPHPSYTKRGTRNDIMILKLDRPIDSSVPRAMFAAPWNEPAPGQQVTTLGLGVTKEGTTKLSPTLKAVQVNVVTHEDCNDQLSYRGGIREDIMICAGVRAGGKDACAGDSGGPMILEDRWNNPNLDLVSGLVSFGQGCGRVEKPGVYARVSAFHNWIRGKICELSSFRPSRCGPPPRENFDSNPLTTRFEPPPPPTPRPTRPPLVNTPTPHPTLPIQILKPKDRCFGYGSQCHSAAQCCTNACITGRCLTPQAEGNKIDHTLGLGRGGAGGGFQAVAASRMSP